MLNVVHSVPGRVRLQTASARRNMRLLRAARAEFAQLDGVTSISPNPATGSIVLCYDQRQLSPQQFLNMLRKTGYVARPMGITPRANTPAESQIVEALSQQLLATIIERSAGALIRSLI
jgi:Ca2+-transporting ATPase